MMFLYLLSLLVDVSALLIVWRWLNCFALFSFSSPLSFKGMGYLVLYLNSWLLFGTPYADEWAFLMYNIFYFDDLFKNNSVNATRNQELVLKN